MRCQLYCAFLFFSSAACAVENEADPVPTAGDGRPQEALILAAGDTAAPERVAAEGERLYRSRCGACHSVDANRIGPKHRGVFGRKAGSVTDYDYSDAVAQSTLIWNPQTLDRWLSNPQETIPGQKMGFRLSNAEERSKIIAYLKTLSAEDIEE